MSIFFPKRPTWPPNVNDPISTGDKDRLKHLVEYDRQARLLRQELFDGDVINDSAWTIMQDLLAAHLDGHPLRTKQLHPPGGLPKATVLRYLDHLEKFDIIHRQVDPDDTRSTLVSLSNEAAFWMAAFYHQLDEHTKSGAVPS